MRDWRIFGIVVTVAALGVWGCFGITSHLIAALDAIRSAAASAQVVEQHISDPHGTIAMADEDLGAMKSAIIHADLVARHEQQSLNTLDARAEQLYVSVLRTVDTTQQTVASLGESAKAATATLNAGTQTLGALPPVIHHADVALGQFDTLYPDIARLAAASATTSEQAARVTTDTRKVADHFEQEIDNPKKRPWYIRILPKAIQDGVQALLERWAVQG